MNKAGLIVNVCAIVLDYRGAAKTEVCLSSLIGERISRVLVVDNSSDSLASSALQLSVERVRKIADFEILVLEGHENLGFSKGINSAIRFDQESVNPHEAYFLLNNDAVVHPGVVTTLIAELGDSDGVGLVAPVILNASGGRQGLIWYDRYFGLQSVTRSPRSFPFLSGCCLLVSTKVLKDGRLFDTSFFMYGEDVQLGWRMKIEGWDIRCIDRCVVNHSAPGSSVQGSLFYEYHMVRAHLLLALKTWRHPAEIPLMLVAKLAWLTGRAMVRTIRYRSPLPVVALFMGLLPLSVRKP